jgi:predicted RNA-binding protein YlxR (DUF448 family)/ribosomal protein L30E
MPTATPSKRTAVRTCAGCRESAPREALVRVVLGEDGAIGVDLKGSEHGRGAWLHARPGCIRKAARGGLARSFRSEVRARPEALAAAVARGFEARIHGLLMAARRSGRLALGSAAVEREIEEERARLLVVARDARAAADASPVVRMIGAGKAAAWGTKRDLGALFGREEVAVLAVLEPRLAAALKAAIDGFSAAVQSVEPGSTQEG